LLSNPKAGVLINSLAKRNRKNPVILEGARNLLSFPVIICNTRSLKELEPALDRLFREKINILVTSGGDGTIHQIVTAMISMFGENADFPAILPLKSGSINMLTNNLKMDSHPMSDLSHLDAAVKLWGRGMKPELHRISCLRFESDAFQGRKYGFIFANGIVFKILKEYYREGEPGIARAFNVTTAILAQSFAGNEKNSYLNKVNCRTSIDGKKFIDDKIVISLACTFPELLLWFNIFDSAKGLRTSDFYLAVNSMPRSELAKNFWPLCRGRYKGERHFNGLAKEAILETDAGFTIDGEVYDPGRHFSLKITNGPVLNFINLSNVNLQTILSTAVR